jgi:glycerate kinase
MRVLVAPDKFKGSLSAPRSPTTSPMGLHNPVRAP